MIDDPDPFAARQAWLDMIDEHFPDPLGPPEPGDLPDHDPEVAP